MTEFDLIAQIQAQAQSHPKVTLGIGDDAAIVRSSTKGQADWVVTTDMLMDGRHFELANCGAKSIGYKSLAANLSDIAAMAAEPVAAFVSVALPKAEAESVALGILAGLKPLADRFGIALAGGDTNAWDGPLVVSMTVIGSTVPPGPVLRSGARPGDAILVTGPLGGSLLGRHLWPEPRVFEALALHRASNLHALIDLSDGLASDLGHVLKASGGLGASLDEEAIPIHSDAHRLAAQDGRSPIEHALTDGEDFELCLAVDPAEADRLLANPPNSVALHRVGTVEAEPGLRLQKTDGTQTALTGSGFDHLAIREHPSDERRT